NEKVKVCKSAIPVVGMTGIGGETREKGALTPYKIYKGVSAPFSLSPVLKIKSFRRLMFRTIRLLY
ncbi:MAG: hypothetical protein K9I74_06485, partial [Bacteroidales bacterium]|nr:hypothetical protein [Bacteroidales bacterium]